MNKALYILLAISMVFSACKKEEGCTDPIALNYNSDAEKDDGSCNYFSSPSLQVTGDTVVYGNTDPITSHLTVTNLSNSTLDVKCRINSIVQDSLTKVQFCWGEACYPEGVLVSGETVSIASNQAVVHPDAPAHSGYYNAYGNKDAIAEVEYCFYDIANPSDETCFTVTFNPTASK